jgi:hypothetical protein
MVSFTLSQAGMFRLFGKISTLKPGETLDTRNTEVRYEKGTGWKRTVSGLGAIITLIVFLVLAATKFTEGAWIILLALPLLVYMFLSIDKHYKKVRESLRTRDLTVTDFPELADVVIIPMGDVTRVSLLALMYAKRLSKDVRVVSIITSKEMHERFLSRWNRFPDITSGASLVEVNYDYRDVLTPLVEYIEQVNRVEFPDKIITVVIPEFVSNSMWENMLHNQTANILRLRLQVHKDIVLIDVPFQIGQRRAIRAKKQTGKLVVNPDVSVQQSTGQPEGE